MADYVLKKIPELDPTLSLVDTDLLVVETSDGTKSVAFANLKSSIPNYGYLSAVFTSLALSGNILTINHAKNTRKIRLTIFNPAGISTPLPWYIVDANNVAINFGGTIEAGDWEYLLEFWTGSGTGSYPDPIYALSGHTHMGSQVFSAGLSVDPEITIIGSYVNIVDRVLVGYIIAKSTVTSTYKRMGQIVIPVKAINDITWNFVGVPYLNTAYESAFGIYASDYIMRGRFGKANTNFLFNFSIPIEYVS